MLRSDKKFQRSQKAPLLPTEQSLREGVTIYIKRLLLFFAVMTVSLLTVFTLSSTNQSLVVFMGFLLLLMVSLILISRAIIGSFKKEVHSLTESRGVGVTGFSNQQEKKESDPTFFMSDTELMTLIKSVDTKLVRVLLVCFVFGAIPFIGFIPNLFVQILFFRREITPYLPWNIVIKNFLILIPIMLIFLLLSLFPVISMFTMPFSCLVSYRLLRAEVIRRHRRQAISTRLPTKDIVRSWFQS